MRHTLAALLLATTTWYAAPAAADDAGTHTSAAYAINDAGDIVGTIDGGAVRWDRNGNITRLSLGGSATVINAAGTAAGGDGGPILRWDLRGRVTNLGGVEGLNVVAAINASGTVVGSLIDSTVGDRAFRSTPSGTLALLPPDDGPCTGTGINAAGTAIGVCFIPSRAIRWDIGRPATSPDDGGTANDINDAGTIVGTRASLNHAARWNPAGRLTDLGTLPGGTRSNAIRINAAGTVAGTADDATGATHVVRWDRAGAITDLGPLGSDLGAVVAINSIGAVVAYSGELWNLTRRPLGWDPAGRPRLLPLPPGAVAGWPTGINATGIISGTVQFPDHSTRAVRWNGAGVAYLPVPIHRARPNR